jgi:hypothetical protein
LKSGITIGVLRRTGVLSTVSDHLAEECRGSPDGGHGQRPAASLPDIDLHDVRRNYLTAGRKARIDRKALSQRVGHSDVAFTMRQYVETDLEADREVANTLAELIIGGFAVTEIGVQADALDEADRG